MTRITATEAQRHFSDILNRIRYQGESFEVARHGEVIAELVPAGRKRFTVGEFLDMWKKRPRLDPEDAEAFERDLAAIRASTAP